MDTTEDLSVGFHAVTDYPAIAVRANWRQRVDRALEAIEGVALSAQDDFKRLVVFVLANFASTHTHSFARGAVRGGVYLLSRMTSSSKPAGIVDPATDLRSRNSSGLKRGGKLSLVAITGVGAVRHANTRCNRGRCAHCR